MKVKYRTEDGTAIGGLDFCSTQGIICFPQGVSTQTVKIELISVPEADQGQEVRCGAFYVQLEPLSSGVPVTTQKALVSIVDGTSLDVLEFERVMVAVEETKPAVELHVLRKGGCAGVVCAVCTMLGDADNAGVIVITDPFMHVCACCSLT
jgi:Calx-beta domain